MDSLSGLLWKSPNLSDLIKEAKEWNPQKGWGELPPMLIAVPAVEIPLGFLWMKGIVLPMQEMVMVLLPIGYFVYEGFRDSMLGKLAKHTAGGNILSNEIYYMTHIKEQGTGNVDKCIKEGVDKKHKTKRGKKAAVGWCAFKKGVGNIFGKD
jgi:hypothetical protein